MTYKYKLAVKLVNMDDGTILIDTTLDNLFYGRIYGCGLEKAINKYVECLKRGLGRAELPLCLELQCVPYTGNETQLNLVFK